MALTKFFGSQVGGKMVVPHSYTGSPLQLLRSDIFSALSLYKLIPFIVWPLKPTASGDLCELYPSPGNLYDVVLHVILLLLQLPFLLSIPFWFFLPFPPITFAIGIALFWAVNQSICYVLNGSKMQYGSDPKYAARKKEHEHEQWIFLNGVAVGRHWLQSNVNRLALTFGRPVLGVHNKTNGILFDIIQCLIQRNFTYATNDVRDCYAIVKETLYKPKLTKVVFILHSQGGIEGGMIIDWLLQEVPQDLLAKLEVYTFGNAANHFNNPHMHLLSQHAALANPTIPSMTHSTTRVHYHDPIPIHGIGGNEPPPLKSSRTSSSSGKAIRYIEHYANNKDFVARWGVLDFISNLSVSPSAPRFMGRCFERQGEGHQFCQHYMDNMFPLKKTTDGKGGIGNSGFEGCDEENTEFMNSILQLGTHRDENKDESKDEREGYEMSYCGTHGEPLSGDEQDVLLRDMSPISPETIRHAMSMEFANGSWMMTGVSEDRMQFRVKDLSRLWLYRNGKSPRKDEVDAGIARMATI